MNEAESNILERARRAGLQQPSAGLGVPEGYFERFIAEFPGTLPRRPEIETHTSEAAPMSLWQRMRPYVYMAAMFAGIWLMLQMFATIGAGSKLKPLDDNPVLASALATDDFVYDYVYSDMNSNDIIDDMIDSDLLDSETDFEALFAGDSADEDNQYLLPQ